MNKKNENKYYEGVGRRKTASARVRIYPDGSGEISINDKPAIEYFANQEDSKQVLTAPFKKTGKNDEFDISVIVRGGGKRGQLEASQLGIARSLVEYDKDLKNSLKQEGFLTRDPRMKERKKPGKKGARRGAQWQKR